MNRSIDLNADLGEGGGNDSLLIPLVSSVNIACGGHAGDEETMCRTMLAALRTGAAIGAHPGYEDRANFGRITLSLEHDVLRDSIRTQLARFRVIAGECGAIPHHVKPHGALYHQADNDAQIASIFIGCVKEMLPACRIYCSPHGMLAAAASAAGLDAVAEGFADRRYQDDGGLLPRHLPNAMLSEPAQAAAQAIGITSHGSVVSNSGKKIPLSIRTLCVHGDSLHALEILQTIRTALEKVDIQIQCP